MTLPESIAAYFASEPDATEGALASIFTANAVVHDEGKEHRGLDAIRDWRIDTMRRTPFTARPLSIAEKDGVVIVPTEVAGSFPGSPLTLNHCFTLRDGRVAALEIG